MGHDTIPPIPADAPKPGEMYRHYKKGDLYKVVTLALHSDDTWHVVYEPMYEGAVASSFTRPLGQWRELVEWAGEQTQRFAKVD